MGKSWQPKGTGDDHRGVIRELRNRRTRNLADKLGLLLEFREHADYHLEASDTILDQYCKFSGGFENHPLLLKQWWTGIIGRR